MRSPLFPALLLAALSGLACGAPAGARSARDAVTKIVVQIKRADYEGHRPALKRLYGDLAPFAGAGELAPKVRYWRGFAMWRSAINGFNDSIAPEELERELAAAIEEFTGAAALDPGFVDAKIAILSCLGYQMYINQGRAEKIQELLGRFLPLRAEVQAADPDNPRFLWVLGPVYWTLPAERGGGQDKALLTYEQGLLSARKRKGAEKDPLAPVWGEPELLMNLAWSNLNRTTPDLVAAEDYARSALQMVPYWHYVRDILLPQILAAKASAAAEPR